MGEGCGVGKRARGTGCDPSRGGGGGGPISPEVLPHAAALTPTTPGGVRFASGRFACGVDRSCGDSAACDPRGGGDGGPTSPEALPHGTALAPTTPSGVGFAAGRFARGVDGSCGDTGALEPAALERPAATMGGILNCSNMR